MRVYYDRDADINLIKDKKIEKNNSKDALKLMSILNKIYKK